MKRPVAVPPQRLEKTQLPNLRCKSIDFDCGRNATVWRKNTRERPQMGI
jgi:hypothetical protein